MSNYTFERQADFLSQVRPILQLLTEHLSGVAIHITTVGVKPASFVSLFRASLLTLRRYPHMPVPVDREILLQAYARSQFTCLDEIAILAPRIAVQTVHFNVCYNTLLGCDAPIRWAQAALAPTDTPHRPSFTNAYEHPYDPDVFRAFVTLKQRGIMTNVITLLNISLDKLPDYSSYGPDVTIIEDLNNIVIL